MADQSLLDAWPERVLVGVDGSERSADALAFGRVLAEQTGASLSTGCVYGASHAFGALGTEVEAHDALRDVFTSATGVNMQRPRVVRAGSPAEGLRRLIGEEAADAVVVGSSHRSGIGRVLPGAVADHLLHGASCAVAVAPNGFASRQDAGLRVIGVGFDGSEESRAALAMAESLALAAGGVLRVFCVLPGGPHASEGVDAIASIREEMIRDLCEATEALPPEVRALSVTLEGDPARELMARSFEVELMVLGTRGIGRLWRLMLGGAVEALLTGAQCPVVVVPVSDDTPAAEKQPQRSALAGSAQPFV